MSTLLRLAATGLLALSCSAAAYGADQPSLYARLGGKGALTAVVNELWTVVAADVRINARFAKTRPEAFGGQLVDFLCQASGGPCTYQGQDMQHAHTGMRLSDAEFSALAEDTVMALDHFKVPAGEKGEVMRLLASLKSDIVNR
ncbi:MAG: group 1 truncated hemoglobin [Pseudomonadota bacterium]